MHVIVRECVCVCVHVHAGARVCVFVCVCVRLRVSVSVSDRERERVCVCVKREPLHAYVSEGERDTDTSICNHCVLVATATHGNTLQHIYNIKGVFDTVRLHVGTLQHKAPHSNTPQHIYNIGPRLTRSHYARVGSHCNTLQHTATHLQY